MSDTPPLLATLLRTDREIARTATDPLERIASDQPELAPTAIDTLRTILELPPSKTADDSIELASVFGSETETRDADCDELDSGGTSVVTRCLATDTYRDDAAWALGSLASQYPDQAAQAFEQLLSLCSADRDRTREYALYAAGRIAGATSADATRCVETAILPGLRSRITGVQAVAAWAATEICRDNADAALPTAQSLKPLVTHANKYVRFNAAEALSLLSQADYELVAPADLAIVDCVKAGKYAPVCVWALARASQLTPPIPTDSTGDELPSILEGHGVLAQLIDGLDTVGQHAEPAVRIAAATALTYLSAYDSPLDETAMERLKALATDAAPAVAEHTSKLIQTGPLHPNWQTDSPAFEPESNTLERRIAPSQRRDGAGNRVYPNDGVQPEIDDYNTYEGQTAVQIDGPEGTTLAKLCAPSGDEVTLNPQLMDHVGLAEGDTATIRPVELALARRISIRLPETVGVDYLHPLEDAIEEHLREKPVNPGDIVPVEVIVEPDQLVAEEDKLYTNATIPVQIEQTVPAEPVLVTDFTTINVADTPAKVADRWEPEDEFGGARIEPRPIYTLDGEYWD